MARRPAHPGLRIHWSHGRARRLRPFLQAKPPFDNVQSRFSLPLGVGPKGHVPHHPAGPGAYSPPTTKTSPPVALCRMGTPMHASVCSLFRLRTVYSFGLSSKLFLESLTEQLHPGGQLAHPPLFLVKRTTKNATAANMATLTTIVSNMVFSSPGDPVKQSRRAFPGSFQPPSRASLHASLGHAPAWAVSDRPVRVIP